MKPILIDVISGFLGAGKTTMISKYAAHCIKKGECIGIIENEFGEMGIDGELLRNSGLSVKEIVNGCICCTLKGDLINTLILMTKEKRFDRIIIEPTGIFMVEEIYNIVKVPEVAEYYKLGAVVTVVDGVNFYKYKKSYTMFFEKQVDWAHRLFVSKADKADSAEMMDIISELQLRTKDKDIISGTIFDYEDWDKLFSHAYSEELNGHDGDEHHHEHHHEHDHNHNEDDNTEGFIGITVLIDNHISKEAMETLLNRIIDGEFGDIPRAKGFMPNGNNGFYSFDLVGKQIDIRDVGGEKREGRINFIGRNINKQALIDIFD